MSWRVLSDLEEMYRALSIPRPLPGAPLLASLSEIQGLALGSLRPGPRPPVLPRGIQPGGKEEAQCSSPTHPRRQEGRPRCGGADPEDQGPEGRAGPT